MFTIRTFKNRLKKEEYFPIYFCSYVKRTNILLADMRKVQKMQGNIDVTSKTPTKADAVVTETPFYDHQVDEGFIFISSKEEDAVTQNAIPNECVKLSKKEEEFIKSKC